MATLSRGGLLLATTILFAGCTAAVRPAPEIEGVDANGFAFKLSDYRGKVVLLDFWRTSCPHCTILHKHERALVEQYEGQPFVILGVSNDPDPRMLRETQREQQISWRSWWDEEHAIAKAWGVSELPTLFIIDKEGTIRKVFYGRPDSDDLDAEIAKWMQ
jgi:peroxiredoxin